MRQETITLHGQPFHIRHWGDEGLPKLLMLHGFPEYGGAWGDLAMQLSDRFHCIAPDQRGYGQSWAPAEVSAYTTSALVGDMASLIGTEPVTVLGHDWGAAVAYGLAMFRADLVSRLIILNGVHPVPFQRAMAAGGAQTRASQCLRGMLNWYRASPLRVAKPGQPITDLPEFDVTRLQVTCPHLLIWGAEDTALLPEATEGLEGFAADLTRVEIAGADHWLHHQKPAAVAEAIRDWL